MPAFLLLAGSRIMTRHTTHPSCSAPTSAGQRRIARALTNLCAGFPARHSSRVPALLLLSVNNWPSRLFSVPGVQEGGAPCTTHLRSAGPRTAQASPRGGSAAQRRLVSQMAIQQRMALPASPVSV